MMRSLKMSHARTPAKELITTACARCWKLAGAIIVPFSGEIRDGDSSLLHIGCYASDRETFFFDVLSQQVVEEGERTPRPNSRSSASSSVLPALGDSVTGAVTRCCTTVWSPSMGFIGLLSEQLLLSRHTASWMVSNTSPQWTDLSARSWHLGARQRADELAAGGHQVMDVGTSTSGKVPQLRQ